MQAADALTHRHTSSSSPLRLYNLLLAVLASPKNLSFALCLRALPSSAVRRLSTKVVRSTVARLCFGQISFLFASLASSPSSSYHKLLGVLELGLIGVEGSSSVRYTCFALRRVTDKRNVILGQTAAQEDVSSISDTHSGQSDEPFREKPRGRSEQPHVKSLATRFPTVTRILRLPLPVQGYHLGRSFIILLYFGVLLFAALYRDSVFKNPNREGFIVASQLPWLYILATKNNFIGLLVGYGYDRVRTQRDSLYARTEIHLYE